MSLQTTRIIALILLFSETYLVGVVPLYLVHKWYRRISTHGLPQSNGEEEEKRSLSSNAIVQVLLQFGGGVLFATVFTHLLPEIKESFETYSQSNDSFFKRNSDSDHKSYDIPFVEIAICCGFFLIFFVEELMHYFLNRFNEHQKKHQNCYNRDLMNRCSNICSDSHENQVLTETKPFSSAFVNYGADLSTEPTIKRTSIVSTTNISNNILTVRENGSNTSNTRISNKTENNSNNNEEISNNNWFTIMFLRGLVIIFAFSVHSVFDGLAIGLQTKTSDLWSMFFAISVHKLVIAFVVSFQLFDQSNKMLLVAIHMALFALMSPIGILIVILSENSLLKEGSESNPIVILLTSIATGTLLYIVFYEILQKDRCERISGFVQLLSIVVGFGVMLTINVFISG